MSQKPDILEAIRIAQILNEACHAQGYLLALYGSTLIDAPNTGKDVDFIAVPCRAGNNFESLILAIKLRGFKPVGAPYIGLLNTAAITFIEDKTGIVLDLQIREIANNPY